MKKKFTFRRALQLICISGASVIYYVPYMISIYYSSFEQAFNANNTQLGLLTSCYTTMTIATYFVGGIVTDKFSARGLLTFSYISTGILAILFGLFPPIELAMVLMAAMGITTTLTFWSAMQKATRIFAGEGNEGLGMGSVEGIRCLISSVISTVALMIFARYTDIVAGVRVVIFMYAGASILIGLGCKFLLEKDTVEKGKSSLLKHVVTCLKNPNVWIMSLIIACFCISYTALKYATPFGTKIFGLSAAMGALMGTFKEYFRPAGAFSAAFISNRIGVSKTIFISGFFVIAVNICLAFIPQQQALYIMVFLGAALGYIIFGAVRGIYFATIGEAEIPMEMTGTVIGIMSTIGFLPESIVPIVFGKILDQYPESVGYPMIFKIAAGAALAGCFVTFYFYRKNKKSIDKILEKKRLERLEAKTTA